MDPAPSKFRLQLNRADLEQVGQTCSIFKGKLLARVAEGVGERWCWSSQQIYRHSARELCCSNGCRRWTNHDIQVKSGWKQQDSRFISVQPSACFINIMKENYTLKSNLSGVLIFLAISVSFQECTCEVKYKLDHTQVAFAAALALFITGAISRPPDEVMSSFWLIKKSLCTAERCMLSFYFLYFSFFINPKHHLKKIKPSKYNSYQSNFII